MGLLENGMAGLQGHAIKNEHSPSNSDCCSFCCSVKFVVIIF